MEFIGMLFFIVFFIVLGAWPVLLLLIVFGIVGTISLIPDVLIPSFKLSLSIILIVVSLGFLFSI